MKSNDTSMNFPNREELSLALVLALPNDSKTIFDCKIWNLVRWNSRGCPVMAARYCKDNFMASVLPEPDSPVKIRHWSVFMSFMDRHARSVTAYLKSSKLTTNSYFYKSKLHVRGKFVEAMAAIDINDIWSVIWKLLVRVDGQKHRSNIRLKKR